MTVQQHSELGVALQKSLAPLVAESHGSDLPVAVETFVAYRMAGLAAALAGDGRTRLLTVHEGARVTAAVLVERLQWDSDIYGFGIGRIGWLAGSTGAAPESRRFIIDAIDAALDVAAQWQVRQLSARVDAEDLALLHACEDREFRVADVSLALALSRSEIAGRDAGATGKGDAGRDTGATGKEDAGRDTGATGKGAGAIGEGHADATGSGLRPRDRRIRAYRAEDLPALRTIAGSTFRYSRLLTDPRFPRDRSNVLFERWIDNACQGRADQVLVAEVDGRAAGFVTCSVDARAERLLGFPIGDISLLGVSPAAQGQRLGGALVDAALDWLAPRVERVEIRTQLTNMPALRLYEKAGFRMVRGIYTPGGVTFHRWM